MKNLHKGIAFIIASAFGFAMMAFFVRLADDFGTPLSCFQKGFFRNAVAFAIALGVFMQSRRHAEAIASPSKNAWGILLARCAFGTFGIFANFYAISRIQLGDAMSLNKTAPFFTVLCSYLFLRERANRTQLLCLITAFVGAMLVVKPGFRLDGLPAALLGLASGLGAGLAYTCVHMLGKMKVSGALIVLVFSAFSCLAAVPFILFDYTPMTFAQVLVLLGAGVGAAIGQFGITAAYRHAEPRAIAAYDYTSVVFSAMLGFAFFGQIPDWASIAGFVLILISAKNQLSSVKHHDKSR